MEAACSIPRPIATQANKQAASDGRVSRLANSGQPSSERRDVATTHEGLRRKYVSFGKPLATGDLRISA